MPEEKNSLDIAFSFLTGGSSELPVDIDYEILARVMMYTLKKKIYHRRNFCRAIVVLSSYAPVGYRDIAWAFIQMLPLSHLLYLPEVIVNPSKENKRRLRHALAVRIARSNEEEIIRAFAIAPGKFRKLFSFFKLPRYRIDGMDVRNPSYLLAVRLVDEGIKVAFEKYTLEDLVGKLKVPLHMVMQYVKDVDTAIRLAEVAVPDDYLRHARWFRSILGDELFEKITLEKIKRLRDPVEFISVFDHLEETGALTPGLLKYLDEKTNLFLREEVRKCGINRLAIIVDVSGSMEAAIDITREIYKVFTRLGGTVTDVIAFSNIAFEVSPKKLNELTPGGTTSIGAGLLLLYKRLSKRRIEEYPQAILLVTDFAENTAPFVRDVIPLYQKMPVKPPIIVLHCGYRSRVKMDYPHAVIPLTKFHYRLLLEIFHQIMSLTASVLEEREMVEVIKEARPLEEALSELKPPKRPPETMKPGFLAKLLSGEISEKT